MGAVHSIVCVCSADPPPFPSSHLQPTKNSKPTLQIDLYDMNFMGKGPFLGRVEIPWEQLVTPPPGEFDYPLKTKGGLAAKKQSKVGGILTLEYAVVKRTEMVIPETTAGAELAELLLEIPRALWLMKAPALMLKVECAVNLAKANVFGGSSDPFVVIFCGTSTEVSLSD